MKQTKPFSGKHVLVLEGYCKQTLPFLRGFKEQGCEVSVLCGSRWDCAYWSRLPDHKILGVCDLHNQEASERYIVELIKKGGFDLVFAPFDFSARVLSHHKEELSRYATIYALDRPVFDRVYNKESVMRVCMENGIPCPKTYFGIEKAEDLDGRIQFPVVIKPHSQYGGRGYHLFHSADEMRSYVKQKGIDLRNYVIQEYIPEGSIPMGANIMIDRNGDIKSSYLYLSEHTYPVDHGTSTLNGMLIRPDITEYCNRLVKLMNLQGEMGMDLVLDVRDNMGKVIEINPRPVHGVTLGFIAGIDHAQQILEDAFGMEVTPMEVTRPRAASRIGQTDFLWFLTSKDRFRRLSFQLGYKPVKEQMFFWDDPLPWLAFLMGGIKDYKMKMQEKRQ